MYRLTTITIITAIIAAAAVASAAAVDTLIIDSTVDTLIIEAVIIDTAAICGTPSGYRTRNAEYRPVPTDSAKSFSPLSFGRTDIFRSDGADAAEILRYRALTSVYVPFTLSGSMNRILPYGHTMLSRRHITSSMASEIPLEYYWARRFDAGNVSGAQAGGFTLSPRDAIVYSPYPDALTLPEFSMYWENGVFNQNTLNIRLARPLTENMTVNLFSDYRYFRGQRFNHERNDIVNFYRTFYRDTSVVMNRGYNPLVDEHVLGGSVMRTESDSSKFYAAFTYGNLANEYVLDIPATELDRLHWAQLDRRTYRIDAAWLDKGWRRSSVDIKSAFISESVESRFEPDTAIATWSDGANSFLIDARLDLPGNTGWMVGGRFRNIENYYGGRISITEIPVEFFYDRSFRPSYGRIDLNANIGMSLFHERIRNEDADDSIFILADNAKLGLGLDFVSRSEAARVGVFWSPYETPTFGVESEIRSEYIGLLLGYQGAYSDAGSLWPMSTPPYPQPQASFIIAPWLSRYRGFSLLTRAIITDTKPHLKASAHLSHIIQPRGMAHTFETELGFDYWSARDPVTFAGFYGWDSPIYDVNLKIAAHIGTFRLFYKMDNMLNLRQAYVPGYFSPGVTFRWGINWFI